MFSLCLEKFYPGWSNNSTVCPNILYRFWENIGASCRIKKEAQTVAELFAPLWKYYMRVVVQIAICLHSAVQKGFFIISPAYGYKMRALREISSLNALRNIAHGMSKFRGLYFVADVLVAGAGVTGWDQLFQLHNTGGGHFQLLLIGCRKAVLLLRQLQDRKSVV